ncbi:MAG: hypothetical protein ACAI25_10250 [Planctomycetota bacterium]
MNDDGQQLKPGVLVKISRPPFDDPTLPRWTADMDDFDGRTLKIRTVEDNGWATEVTLEEARNCVTFFRFAAEWVTVVDTTTFMGFCDACGGFRAHRRLCPADPARREVAA